jgi:glycosyltransferase involved in cell wall biosynthesis
MKILVCVDRPWPCDHAFIEEVLAKGLPQLGHEVRIVFSASKGVEPGERAWHGATAVVSKHGRRSLFTRMRSFLREVRRKDWDWLFVRNDSLIALAGTMRRTPVAFQLSHQMEETRLEMVRGARGTRPWIHRVVSLSSRAVRRAAMARARLVLPISEHLEAVLRQTGERKGASVVMPLGAVSMPPPRVQERLATRAELGLPADAKLLLYLGTLNRLRRLDTLIDAVTEVRKSDGKVVLWMVGDGPSPMDRASLQEAVAARGAQDFVHLPGRVSRAETFKLIAAADFGLSYFPDIDLFQQNSPTKMMEYLGLGLPAICTPQPEHRHAIAICDGGIVSQGHDARTFAAAIQSALGKSWDRERIQREFLAVRSYGSLSEKLARALDGNLNR